MGGWGWGGGGVRLRVKQKEVKRKANGANEQGRQEWRRKGERSAANCPRGRGTEARAKSWAALGPHQSIRSETRLLGGACLLGCKASSSIPTRNLNRKNNCTASKPRESQREEGMEGDGGQGNGGWGRVGGGCGERGSLHSTPPPLSRHVDTLPPSTCHPILFLNW